MRPIVRIVAAVVVVLAFGVGVLLALPTHAEAPDQGSQPAAASQAITGAPAPAPVLAAAPAAKHAGAAKKKAAFKGAVNVNTATAAQLEGLPGIGPSKAQRIIDARERRPFKRVEDLVRVKGIGPKTVKKLRPYLKVEGPTDFRRE